MWETNTPDLLQRPLAAAVVRAALYWVAQHLQRVGVDAYAHAITPTMPHLRRHSHLVSCFQLLKRRNTLRCVSIPARMVCFCVKIGKIKGDVPVGVALARETVVSLLDVGGRGVWLNFKHSVPGWRVGSGAGGR